MEYYLRERTTASFENTQIMKEIDELSRLDKEITIYNTANQQISKTSMKEK